MLSEPYGSHYIRLRYQTASRRRRTIIFSHSFFWTASNSSDMLSVGRVPSACRFVSSTPDHLRRDHLPSASVRGPRQPTRLWSSCAPRPTSRGPAQQLQCSRRVRRGRRDQSGGHGRQHGTVCDVPQACRRRRGMLQPPSTLRHLPFSPRPRHAGCDAPRRAAPRMRGPACAFPGSDEGGSSAARAADAPCGAQHTMRRSSPALSCNVQHATCDRQHSAPCNSRRARHVQAVRVRLCTRRHSRSSAGLRAVCARAKACVRA